MQLTINKKEYDFKFGMAFLRELNEQAGLITQGVNVGLALQRVIPSLLGGDTAGLETVIWAGLKGGDYKVPLKKLDEWFESMDANQVKELMDQTLDELDKSNATHGPLAEARENIKAANEQ